MTGEGEQLTDECWALVQMLSQHQAVDSDADIEVALMVAQARRLIDARATMIKIQKEEGE